MLCLLRSVADPSSLCVVVRGAVVDLARKGRRFPALLFVGKLIASDARRRLFRW